ncbi:MAG: DUF3784 domain-containing protein [Bacillota bacterium]|nr:DUF3784 domain-containing protein [Bacillota bacterium]
MADSWINMHMWTFTCLVLAVPLAIVGVIFTLLKEKGAILISGFNTLSKEEREEYDKKKMSRDVRNDFFLWSGILFTGAALSWLFHKYFGAASIAVWIFLF